MVEMEIVVDKDYVIIEGQKVTRPSHVSRSYWLDFWGWAKAEADGDPE